MAQLPSVPVPEKTWVNLYTATSIAVGTQIIIQNIGSSECWLVDSTSEPDEITTGYNVINEKGSPNSFFTSDNSPDGAWAYSLTGATLQVERA